MNKSESIAKLSAAFVKAQAEMSGAKKSAKNPFFKSNYANLEEIIYCVREPFATHGLGFIQFPIAGKGSAGVETIILHESGEWISGDFLLDCVKSDPQGMGSAITYARRYGLQSAVGIPSEDDDGQAASTPTKVLTPTADQVIASFKSQKTQSELDVKYEKANTITHLKGNAAITAAYESRKLELN
tara:strand:+ start:595 stop:1152 length:558 start_codon:yes stop_codon:yes gene_type:complete